MCILLQTAAPTAVTAASIDPEAPKYLALTLPGSMVNDAAEGWDEMHCRYSGCDFYCCNKHFTNLKYNKENDLEHSEMRRKLHFADIYYTRLSVLKPAHVVKDHVEW